MKIAVFLQLALATLVAAGGAAADDVRYVRDNGTLYRETVRTVKRPVVETRIEQVTRTVYRQEVTSETREVVRHVWTPVREYVCEPYVANRWNPFARPCVAYRLVPRTRWECRTETAEVPVTCRRLVPRTETVQRPVTTLRMASEQVVSRVRVSGTGATMAASPPRSSAPARYVQVGGVARLDKDPPRHGILASGWSSATTLR